MSDFMSLFRINDLELYIIISNIWKIQILCFAYIYKRKYNPWENPKRSKATICNGTTTM